MAKKVKKYKIKDTLTLIAVIILIVFVVLYYFYFRNDGKQNNKLNYDINSMFDGEIEIETDLMKIHFIDIGQGDCIFIQFPDGKNMLIDSGDQHKGDIIINYLDKLSVDKIDILLATHPHADHIGSMLEIFERYDVSYCFRPFVYYSGKSKLEFNDEFNMLSEAKIKSVASSNVYYKFLKAVSDEGCGWSFFNKDSDFEQTVIYDDNSYTYKFDFLTPTDNVPYIGYNDLNLYSPLCRLSYGEFSIMFTGDAEAEVEEEYLNYYKYHYTADVLKVGHHGSKTSSSKDFVKSINPEYAVIMCAMDNKYAHPHKVTLNTLKDVGSLVYRTDLQGNIVIEIDSTGEYKFNTEKTANYDELYKSGNELKNA